MDRLYVYDAVDDTLVAISEEVVTAYTYTQTTLYYVTEEQKIYKTDYSGTNHEFLYQCTQGDIDNLSSYFDSLYFIENRSAVMLLDVASKTAQEIWICEDLSWVIMLSTDQLIATTAGEDDYLYDIPTKTVTLISDIESTNLVTAAVKGTPSNNARTTATSNFAAIVTPENDVSFPVPGYNVVAYNSYPTFERPVSWFHNNGQEGCSQENCKFYSGSSECEGFAKYVHDIYAHMGDDTYVDSDGDGVEDSDENYRAHVQWQNRTCITYHRPPAEAFADKTLPANIDKSLTPLQFNDDVDEISGFFGALETGAYVRYGKFYPKDKTPENGCHSIVFIASDADGIWVYECNQDYDTDSNHGCGVFIQYYLYRNLTKYKFVLNYVNHNFEKAPVYDSTTYHKVGCTKCIGYLRQKHDNVSATLEDRLQHYATFNCCNGGSAITAHTGTVSYSTYSNAKHKITSSCCSGYVLEDHFYILNAISKYVCKYCGKHKDLDFSEPTLAFDDPITAVAYTE